MNDLLRRVDWLFVAILMVITGFYVWGVRGVPFHPDETSLLYQSADLEVFLTDPLSLAWDASPTGEKDKVSRPLHPPVPKIILGIGRRLAGYGPETVAVDWDWSESWDVNRERGALPDERLLVSARLANVVLLAFSLVLIYLSGLRVGGRLTGIAGALLLGVNALVLLHGRRAMAEGALVFGVSLAILGLTLARDRPWLTGVGAATAVLSKLSAGALFPVGLAVVAWPEKMDRSSLRKAAIRSLMYLGAFLGEIVFLEPLLWRHPLEALSAVWRTRLDFSSAQVELFGALAPSQVLHSPLQRLASLIGNTFIAPPQFAEVGNYVSQMAPQGGDYLAIPGHAMLRGVFGGGVIFMLTLAGIGLAALRFQRRPSTARFALASLAVGFVAQALSLYAAISLPFQRFYIPLIPFICLWAGYALGSVINLTRLQPSAR